MYDRWIELVSKDIENSNNIIYADTDRMIIESKNENKLKGYGGFTMNDKEIYNTFINMIESMTRNLIEDFIDNDEKETIQQVLNARDLITYFRKKRGE